MSSTGCHFKGLCHSWSGSESLTDGKHWFYQFLFLRYYQWILRDVSSHLEVCSGVWWCVEACGCGVVGCGGGVVVCGGVWRGVEVV